MTRITKIKTKLRTNQSKYEKSQYKPLFMLGIDLRPVLSLSKQYRRVDLIRGGSELLDGWKWVNIRAVLARHN